MAKTKEISITVSVSVHEPDSMFLREEIATGEVGVSNFEYARNLYGHGTLVRFDEEGPWYLLNIKKLVTALHEHQTHEVTT